MSVRTETLQLRVLVDGTPARRELATLDQEYAKLNSGLKDLKKNTKEWQAQMAQMDTIKARQAELRKEIGDTALSAKQLTDELKRLQVQQRNTTPNTAQWAENAARIEQLKQRLRELNDVNVRAASAWEVQRQGMKLAQMSMRELEMESKFLRAAMLDMVPGTAIYQQFDQQLQRVEGRMAQGRAQAGTLGGAWNSLKATGLGLIGSFVGVGTAVYGALRIMGDATQTIKDYEQGLSRIKALGGEYAASVNVLGEAARTAGVEYGINAIQALDAVEALAKAGLTAQQILGGGLNGALTLAAAGEMTVAEAAEIASKTMTQFALSGADIPHVADLLAAGAANATGTVQDMGEALKQSGQVVNQFGIPLESAIGTLTAFASAGLLGSDAGTSFRTMLLRLANPSEEAAGTMKKLGIAAYDVNGQFVGIGNLAGQLQRTMRGLTEEQRNQALATIFGSDAIRAANVLFQQGEEGLARYTKAVDQAGYAQDVARKQTDNWAGDTKKLDAEWKALILDLDKGDGLISKIGRTWTQGLTGVVKEMGKLRSFSDVLDMFANPQRAIELQRQEVRIGMVVERMKTWKEVQAGVNQAALDLVKAQAVGDSNMERLARTALTNLQARAKAINAAEAALVQKAATGNTVTPTTTGGGTTTETDEQKRAREAAMKNMEAMRDTLIRGRRALELAAMNADERELAQIDDKYAEQRARFVAQEGATAEMLKELDAQWALERANAIEEQGEKRVKLAGEAAQKALKAEQDAQDKLFENNLGDEESEVVKKLQEMDTLLAAVGASEEQRKEIVEQAERGIQKIRKKYRTQEEADAAAARNKRIQEQIAIYQGVNTALAGVNSLLAAAYTAAGNANYQNTVAAKALGLAQIAISSGVAVAGAIQAGAAAGPFPANLAAIATGVGAVLSGIANAVSLLSAANPTPPQNSAAPAGQPANVPLGEKGGVFDGPSHADDGLKVVNPHTGRIVAEVEGGEPWMVLSKMFRRNNPGLVNRLLRASATGEQLHLAAGGGVFGAVPAFNFARATDALHMAAGGVALGLGKRTTRGSALVNTPTAPGTGSNGEMMALLKVIAMNTGATVNAVKKPKQSYVVLKQLREKETEDNYLKDRTKVKRLR